MTISTATSLDNHETLELIRALPDHALQCRRMVEYLAHNPQSPSGFVSHHCSIGNLSDAAHKINKRIFKFGYFVACERPPSPIFNKFNEKSQQFLWSIHRLPEAANDPTYETKTKAIKAKMQAADGQILDGIVVDPGKLMEFMNMKDPDDLDELLRVLDLTDETDPDRIKEVGQAYIDHAQALMTYQKVKSGS